MGTRTQLWLMAVILLSAVGAAIWFYYSRFGLTLGLEYATDPADWGSFGDYIGGLLNPLISLFAFYWLGSSVRLQGMQLKDSANAINEAAKHQVAQEALALKGHQLASLNMELSAIQSEISYHQSLLGTWLDQFHAADRPVSVVSPDGIEMPIWGAVTGTGYTLKKLRGEQRRLIDRVKSLSAHQ